jgi:TolB-like protein
MEGLDRVVYSFGDFRLDACRRALLAAGDGARIPIAPKVFDTTLYFVQHAGELLPKERMLAELWPGLVVEENNLTQAVCELRRALGESRGDNRYVVTVPRRGYQFVAEVARTSQSLAAVPASGRTVAVVSFSNLGRLARDDFLAIGLVESIRHRLARTPGLRLVAPIAVIDDAHQQGRAHQAARAPDCRYLVEGSIQRAGRCLRITAQVTDTTDGTRLWSIMLDRRAHDVFAVQDEVSLRVSRAIRRRLLEPSPVAAD